MSSTATTRLRLEKQGTGDNPNDWGNRANNDFDLLDEAIAGFASVAVASNVTLTSNTYASDQSRRAVLRFTGAGGFTVTFPAVEKLYFIDCQTTADVSIKTPTGSSVTVLKGTKRMVYCDGTNMVTDTTVLNSASTTAFTPTGNVAATNVQSAIAELDNEKAATTGATFTGAVSGTSASFSTGLTSRSIAVYGSQALAAAGGVVAINTGEVALCDMTFTATANNVFVVGGCSISNSGTAIDCYYTMRLYNQTTGGTLIFTLTRLYTLAASWGGVGVIGFPMAAGSLTLGSTYLIRLGAYTASAPSAALNSNASRIEGIHV